jgi:GNAT superfamily N-acetyltransferase
MKTMDIRVLQTDHDIAAASDIMAELRPHLLRETFVDVIRGQERAGYVLVGGFDAGDRLVTLAGYRCASTLFRGPHLFVDDLVTTAAAQKQGHGTTMLAWLGREALANGLSEVWLDSRSTARGFYEQLGFELKNSIPCRIAADVLATKDANP